MRYSIIAAITFENFGITLILIKGICSPYGPLGGNEYCDDGLAYASLLMFPCLILMWTFGYSLVKFDKVFMNTQQAQLTQLTKLDEAIKENSTDSIPRMIGRSLMMPNPLCCIIAIILAIIPGYQSFFFDKTSIIYSLADCGYTILNACIIVSQVLLGSNLYLNRKKRSLLTKKMLVQIVFTKNIAIPAINLAVFYFLWTIETFGDNKVMAYILFISFSCPTAMVSMLFAQLLGVALNEIVQSMLWIYLFSIPGIVFWTFLFFLIF